MIPLLDNFSIKKKAPDVERQLHENLEALLAYDTRYLPDVYEVNLKSDGSRWRYMASNIEYTTEDGVYWGKWRKLESGGAVNLSGYYTKQENDLLLLNKVDKETGKSLIADTEIERLATLENYDDSNITESVNNNATDIAALQALVGSSVLNTTSQKVTDAINEIKNTSETASNALDERVTSNEEAITKLNGTGDGSVYKQTQSALTTAKLYTDNELSKLNTTSAMVVDEKPTVNGSDLTYIKDGELKTIASTDRIANAWFYYFVDSQLMQTRFIFGEDGTTSELTIASSNQDFSDYINKNYDILSVTYTPDTASIEKVVTVQSLHDLYAIIKTGLDEKIAIASIIDDLLSTSTTAPLSANQGRVLNESINTKLDKVFPFTDDVSEVANKNVMTDSTGKIIVSDFDDAINPASSNALQNKAVAAELDKKLPIEQGVENANKVLKVNEEGKLSLADVSALGSSAENVSFTNADYPTYTNVDIALKEILTRLDWVDINIDSFVVTPSQTQYEYGHTVRAGTLTFSWLLNKNDITSITLTDMSPALTDSSCTFEHDLSTTKTFALSVSDGKASHSKTIKISFDNKVYWGASSTIPDEFTSEWVLGLANSKFATGKAGDYSFNADTNEYGIIVMPSSFGSPVCYIGGFETTLENLGQLNFTNASGGQRPYTVYKTGQHSLGSFTMNLK